MEGQVRTQESRDYIEEGHGSSSNEPGRQEETVGNDEGTLGSEEQAEGIARNLNAAVQRFV